MAKAAQGAEAMKTAKELLNAEVGEDVVPSDMIAASDALNAIYAYGEQVKAAAAQVAQLYYDNINIGCDSSGPRDHAEMNAAREIERRIKELPLP